jgi:hypothetical protein
MLKNLNYPLLRLVGGYAHQLGIEGTDMNWINIGQKLDQLAWLEESTRLLNAEAGSKNLEMRKMRNTIKNPENYWKIAEEHDAILKELQILTESYYHLAQVFRDLLKKVPGLSNIEFVGIRTVRNNLLCHPERHIPSFAYGGPMGPIIKPDQEATDYIDKGLFVNIDEMKRKILEAVKRESSKRNLKVVLD